MQERAILQAVIHAIRWSKTSPPARVLDLSCGDGDVLDALAQQGFSVEGTHYRDDDYILRQKNRILNEARIHKNVDLSQPLPFPDASYDVVLATEVLEHLPSQVPVLTEIGRILKEGGVFIFTTPNIHRWGSRIQFLFTGTHNLCGARLGWHVARQDLYSTHFNPVYFPVIHTLLHHNHLRVRRLGFTVGHLWEYLLFPLLYPVAVLATLAEVTHFWKRSPVGGKDLLRWLLHPWFFLSDQLVVVAVKMKMEGAHIRLRGDAGTRMLGGGASMRRETGYRSAHGVTAEC